MNAPILSHAAASGPGLSRRRFLQSAAASATMAGLPAWFGSQSDAVAAPALAPNEQPAVALVGCGGMGRGDAKNASRFGRIVAVCDVDQTRVQEAAQQFPGAKAYSDFRKVMERDDIHVVICGTVDHWHTLVSLAAMKSGKDVYCEKPLTLTIDEGKRLVAAVKSTGRILQTGSQQRSDRRFRLACELVRNGRLGRLQHVDVWLPAGRREGPFRTSPVPEGFAWDFWRGQTPAVDYVKERTHLTFRYWYEYSGGTMTDWGAHHNDIALWGIGPNPAGPVSVEGRSTVAMIPEGFSAASEYEIRYTYANGVTHTCRSTAADTWSGGVADRDGQRHGVKFIGADGWIWVTRGDIKASDPELLNAALPASAPRLAASDDHMGNFFESLRTRKAPVAEAEVGHRAATLCHLGVIAMRLGRPLKWDPQAEEFAGDREANGWLSREMRKPYDYDMI